MNKTGIEYLDYSYNPIIMRCTPISKSCTNCWHLAAADRLQNNPTVPEKYREIYAGNRGPHLATERLQDPFRVKSPKFVGVQFMGDLFHPSIPDSLDETVFKSMAAAPWHRYLLLTKRPEKLLEYKFPPYVWVGVTAETQFLFNSRVSILSKVKASTLFASLEPMLDEISIDRYGKQLNWVIAGCESGSVKNRRPTDWGWIMSLRDQCASFKIPFFLKQMAGVADSGAVRIIKMPFLDGRVWDQRPKGEDK